jgi:hypothetical protein
LLTKLKNRFSFLDLPVDEKPTITIVDGGAFPFRRTNFFGLLGLLFAIYKL